MSRCSVICRGFRYALLVAGVAALAGGVISGSVAWGQSPPSKSIVKNRTTLGNSAAKKADGTDNPVAGEAAPLNPSGSTLAATRLKSAVVDSRQNQKPSSVLRPAPLRSDDRYGNAPAADDRYGNTPTVTDESAEAAAPADENTSPTPAELSAAPGELTPPANAQEIPETLTPTPAGETDARTAQETPTAAAPEPATAAPEPAARIPTGTATSKLVKPEAAAELVDDSEIGASTFRGVEPGKSKTAQLLGAWGEPKKKSTVEGDTTYLYESAPFQAIQVQVAGDVVRAILIQLATPLPPTELAERLQLDYIHTVEVTDEQGQLLGRAFPERGVLFSYAPGSETPSVAQILLETVDPQAFLLRAESFWRSRSESSLNDLSYVIQEMPDNPAPLHIAARIYLELGQVDSAYKAILGALRLDKDNAAFQLTHALCLSQRGNHAEAVKETAAVRRRTDISPLVRARALIQMGDLVADGPNRDFKVAMELHLEAIKIAEPLATDPLVAQRRVAKELLIEANLAVARDVAWGNWNRKDEVVPKWVERADTFAREAMARDGGGPELRVHVIERALAAHAGFAPAVDPARFLETAEAMTQELTAATDDSMAQRAAQWQLGRIYNHAVRLSHLRGATDEGLRYADLAREKLEQAAVGRDASPQARNELGRLYFNLGALHAVHRQDHEKAIEWYDRANALLVSAEGTEALAGDAGQLGEMFVSMGVSYWQVDLKQKALELTSQGVKLVQEAVEQGTLAPASLSIPYANLASMYQDLGDPQKAADITRTAEKLDRIPRR